MPMSVSSEWIGRIPDHTTPKNNDDALPDPVSEARRQRMYFTWFVVCWLFKAYSELQGTAQREVIQFASEGDEHEGMDLTFLLCLARIILCTRR